MVKWRELSASFCSTNWFVALKKNPPMSCRTPSLLAQVGWNQNSTAPAALSKPLAVGKVIQSALDGTCAPAP